MNRLWVYYVKIYKLKSTKNHIFVFCFLFYINKVNINRKVGVDPKFRFDTSQFSSESVSFYETTSDNYFARDVSASQIFDLVHIDGLHTFEQTIRDFCASLVHAHPRTIWLIDDTRPESYAQADRSQDRCQKIKSYTNENNGKWMGDVFKVVAFIHDFFPQYSFANFPDHGQTVVWRKTRTDFRPQWDSMEKIERLSFADFLDQQQGIFKQQSYENILNIIERDLRT